jgi:hypothetical protein
MLECVCHQQLPLQARKLLVSQSPNGYAITGKHRAVNVLADTIESLLFYMLKEKEGN